MLGAVILIIRPEAKKKKKVATPLSTTAVQ